MVALMVSDVHEVVLEVALLGVLEAHGHRVVVRLQQEEGGSISLVSHKTLKKLSMENRKLKLKVVGYIFISLVEFKSC